MSGAVQAELTVTGRARADLLDGEPTDLLDGEPTNLLDGEPTDLLDEGTDSGPGGT